MLDKSFDPAAIEQRLYEGWERAGGTFIHHVAAARSIAALRRLGFTGEPRAPPG